MKKQRNYAWLAVLFVFVMAAVPSVLPSLLKAESKKDVENAIIKYNIDERGLASISYVQNGNKWALDYLTANQVDSLKAALGISQCFPPCPYGLCQGYVGRASDGVMCACCAERNGYCTTHSNQAPKKDPPIAN